MGKLTHLTGGRYGKLWTEEELDLLHFCIFSGASLHTTALTLERPVAGLISKACMLRWLTVVADYGSIPHTYLINPRYRDRALSCFSEDMCRMRISKFHQPPQEAIMAEKEKNIETLVMIQGENAANKTDTQLYALIGTLEGQIKKLEAIENKPKKLEKAIASLRDDIAKIVAYVDSRE